ncbi:MAG: 1,4-dihydroxy-2-naphthoate polyprenyltransferase [Sciscionella sp.]
MATMAQWVEGARPRTLPNAIAPVVLGSGVAIGLGGFVWWRALLALMVSLALIVGVNFANDYSDGVRGTDADRVGPLRLVGAGLVRPKVVRAAAFGSFALAGLAGLILVVAAGHWWLLIIGLACLLGAWFYTGGSKPYGYAGLGEPAVFVFFGLIGVLGTVYVQAGGISWRAVLGAIAIGAFSAAVLIANNLRDVHSDPEAGKFTLAVRLGEPRTRALYTLLVALPLVVSLLSAIGRPTALLGLIAALLLVKPVRVIRSGASSTALIPVLRDTGLAMLSWSLLSAIGLALG